MPDRRTPRLAATLVFLATLAAYLVTAGGSLGTQDAVAVYFQTTSIVDRGAIDVPLEISGEKWLGVDGRYHLPFGIGQAVYNVPFYLAGKAVVRATGLKVSGSAEPVLKACVALGSTVAAAAAVAFTFLLAWRLTGSVSASLMCAVLLAFGTPMWLYGKFGFNTALTAATLTIGTYGLLVGRLTQRMAPYAWGAAALAFAVLTRHEMALAGLAALLWVAFSGTQRWDRRIRAALVVGSILAASAAAWMGFNWWRFGNPLEAGHSPTFGVVGFAGLLVSPAASLFVYAPIATIGLVGVSRLWKERHPSGTLFTLVGIVLFVFYASLEDWIGTRSYGPRYLVPLLPMLCAAAPIGLRGLADRFKRARALYLAVVALSVLVQLPSVAVNFVTVRGLSSAPTANQAPFSWASAPVVLNTQAMGPALAANWDAWHGRIPTAFAAAGTAALPGGSDLSSKLSFSFDFWWLYLYYLGKLTAATALLAPAGLTVISALLFRRAAVLRT